MLKIQLDNFKSYEWHVRDNLEIIIVDDGSTKYPAKFINSTGCSIRLFRTLVDIRWNQDFCRNLGVSQCKTGWVLLTDIDHLIPNDTLLKLMKEDYISNTLAYRFGRVTSPEMTPYKHHPNTWFMTKDLYYEIGGYDERMAGYYGTDGDFAARVKKISEIVLLDELKIIRVTRDEVPDASTTVYGRKEEMDKEIRNILKNRKEIKDFRPLTLQAPWEQVQ
jgi:glycosyltransferase involved in cell wall biosynthesis